MEKSKLRNTVESSGSRMILQRQASMLNGIVDPAVIIPKSEIMLKIPSIPHKTNNTYDTQKLSIGNLN